jgi:hypothetical protein
MYNNGPYLILGRGVPKRSFLLLSEHIMVVHKFFFKVHECLQQAFFSCLPTPCHDYFIKIEKAVIDFQQKENKSGLRMA